MDSLAAFYNTGPRTTAEAFPPACLRTHWDPTMVVKHVLPPYEGVTQALDPRPAAKICFAYHHTSAGDAPLPPPLPTGLPATPREFLGGLHRPPATGPVPWPPGGAAELGFPYRGYSAAVETDVLRIDEPLTKCAEKRYIPPNGIPAPDDSTDVVPGSRPPLRPEVLDGPRAGCREADDAAAWARSDRLFFNPTKYDRSTAVPPGVRQATSRHALPYPY